MDFSKRYSNLNTAQKEAVDTFDGPVMVIAGPGTGKTELLSMRAANILKQTDAMPENILCLTFTDSGANAMRERLTDIIGKEAYKVAIHTFHSFGTEVINQNGQYFYQGAHFRAADTLSSYEIIRDIFTNLDYKNPLAKKLNDEYTHLSDTLTVISEIKKSGLTSDELLAILDENNAVIEKTEQLLSPIFTERISNNTISAATKCIDAIRQSGVNNKLSTVLPLSQILADSLETAINEALEIGKTTPLTAWKNQWLKKDVSGNYILKSHERQVKLRAVCFLYEQYLSQMEKAALYDFDDMILRVVHAMEVYDDLRFNLQEKYQYIMVDEFQDTNMAQMRILHNLTNNEVQGDTPNIMVVGDDDQAIYSFQGADVSNILDFRSNYPKVKIIALTDNYRSTNNILDGSRNVILQGNNRLENIIDGLSKKLTSANNLDEGSVDIHEAETISGERHWLINNIKSQIESGKSPSDIAVLTRRHSEVNSLLPYFLHAGIAVNYERRDNALDIAPVVAIEQLARLLIDLSSGNHNDVNATLPEMLANKAWNIEPIKLWQLSTKAYDNRSRWLDIMAVTPDFLSIHDWLIATSTLVDHTPLEQMLDIIIGKSDADNGDGHIFVSPLYNYFFSNEKLKNSPSEYLMYLEALRTIRTKLREYQPNTVPTLRTFIEFIELNRKIGSTISVIRRSIESKNAVNIMTAHKSKGLEFDTVYVINAVDTIWGERARNRNRLISYPENLPLAPAGETSDEKLRLFYVAITRAKKYLHISYSLNNDSGKNTMLAAFLVDSKWPNKKISSPKTDKQLIEAAELSWYQHLVEPTTADMRDLLLPTLKNYKLSATHLNNFLDVSRGGPAAFLLNNLLRFPSAKSTNAAFGTAIHNTLQSVHSHMTLTGKMQATEDIILNFESNLKAEHLNDSDLNTYLQKGIDAIQVFIDKNQDSFSPEQKAEPDFSNQHSILDTAHLTGKLDVVKIDKPSKTIVVTDYKTGKPSHNWSGKTDFEKIKLHKYKQQLIFYKLLVENARDYRGYEVVSGIMQFIEPTATGDIIALDAEFSSDEIERFTKLVDVVWQHIINLDLPDISGYEQSYKGILTFEQDLIDGKI